MSLSRRDFLKRLSAATAVGTAAILGGADFDPEKLLYVPGQRAFFLPPEKRMVVGEEAVSAFEQVKAESKGFRLGWTKAGTVVMDSQWNVISISGRLLTAVEAASMRQSEYGGLRSNNRRPLEEETALVVAQRKAAGWSRPKGRYEESAAKAAAAAAQYVYSHSWR